MPDLLKVKFKQTCGFVAIQLAMIMVLLVGLATGTILVQQNQDIEKKAASVPPCTECVSNKCVPYGDDCDPRLNECRSDADCASPPPDITPPEATPTRAKDPDYCNGCWVAKSSFCVSFHETNSGYICCPSDEGGRNYPHFEKGNTCGSIPTPGDPKNENECLDADGCWLSRSSTCIPYHVKNTGYICCGKGEGEGHPYPHFVPGGSCGDDNSTITPAELSPKPSQIPIPTLIPCRANGEVICHDEKTIYICQYDKSGNAVYIPFQCWGKEECGISIYGTIGCLSPTPTPSVLPSPIVSPVPSPTLVIPRQTNSSNLLSLFQRILEFFTFKGKAL